MTAPTPTAVRAAADLAAIREQWGDLLAAIEEPPAAEWPPREARGFLDQLAAADADRHAAEPVIGRVPLTLREHPAPLNLSALTAALDVERDLFAFADHVASRVQRLPRAHRTETHGRYRYPTDTADRDHPARWRYQTAASPGSRVHGLHWAAVWLEGRALNDAVPGAEDLCTPLPPLLLDQLAATARAARRQVERVLGRDGRTTDLPDPCPWCGGSLAARTRAGGEPVVLCRSRGACSAPAEGRTRGVWRGAELAELWGRLDGARRAAA
ncbi:hypothetical protein [Streptomyces sp. NPDC047046]|uniref:hypothetical protein n=1 Tax=Streptomyces sp. NPDC047046 TaxID=3155378 RepID=UPI0033C40A33